MPHAPAPPPGEGDDEVPVEGLSEVQIDVLRRVMNGADISSAAVWAGVNRGTVHRWHKNPRFAAVLDAWKLRTRQVTRNQLVALTERCVHVLSDALDRDDARVAMQLLKYLGMLTPIEEPPVQITIAMPGPAPATEGNPQSESQAPPTADPVPQAKAPDAPAPAPPPYVRTLPLPTTPRTLKEVRELIKQMEAKFGDIPRRPDIFPTNRSNR